MLLIRNIWNIYKYVCISVLPILPSLSCMTRLAPQGLYLKPESFCLGSERITLNCMFVFFSFFLFLNGPHSRIHLHGLMAYQMAINDAFM